MHTMTTTENTTWVRDLDMIRDILLRLEQGEMEKLQRESNTDLVLANHLRLLIEAELIHGEMEFDEGGNFYISVGLLRWEGYELLDNLRSPRVYEKVKTGIGRMGSWTLPVIQNTAVEILKKAFLE